jgi:hypothetical protein
MSLQYIKGREYEGATKRRSLASGEPETQNLEMGFLADVISGNRDSGDRESEGQDIKSI